eukprot:scaffold52182_cov61-Phaeocystis_antarctica.AAC.2
MDCLWDDSHSRGPVGSRRAEAFGPQTALASATVLLRTYRSVVPSGVRPLPTHAHTERGPEDQGAPSSLQPHCTAPLGGGVHEDAGVAA